MSELEWLLRGGSLDAPSGVVLPGVHLAERIEAVGRRAKAELLARIEERRAGCAHRHVTPLLQFSAELGMAIASPNWRCTDCGLEATLAEMIGKVIERAYQVKPEDLTATTAARQVPE